MKFRFAILCVFLGFYLTQAKAVVDEKLPAPDKDEIQVGPATQKVLTETNTVQPEKTKTSSYGNTDLEDYPEDTEVDSEEEEGENIDEEDPTARNKVHGKNCNSKRCGLGFRPFGHEFYGHGFHHGIYGHGFGHGGYGHGYFGHGYGGYGGHGFGYGYGLGVGHTTLGYPGGFHGFHGGYPRFGYGGPWIGPGVRVWGYGEDEGFHGDGYPGVFVRSIKGGGDGCGCKPPSEKKDKKKSKKSEISNEDNKSKKDKIPTKKCFYGDFGGHGCGHPPLFPYNVKWTKTKSGYKVDIKKVKHKGDCDWPWLYGSGFGFAGHGYGHGW